MCSSMRWLLDWVLLRATTVFCWWTRELWMGRCHQFKQVKAQLVNGSSTVTWERAQSFCRPVTWVLRNQWASSQRRNSYRLNCSTVEKEVLALTWALKHFDVLVGSMLVYVDHYPTTVLTFPNSLQCPNQRLIRWCWLLQSYWFIKGLGNADALSRAPYFASYWYQVDDEQQVTFVCVCIITILHSSTCWHTDTTDYIPHNFSMLLLVLGMWINLFNFTPLSVMAHEPGHDTGDWPTNLWLSCRKKSCETAVTVDFGLKRLCLALSLLMCSKLNANIRVHILEQHEGGWSHENKTVWIKGINHESLCFCISFDNLPPNFLLVVCIFCSFDGLTGRVFFHILRRFCRWLFYGSNRTSALIATLVFSFQI